MNKCNTVYKYFCVNLRNWSHKQPNLNKENRVGLHFAREIDRIIAAKMNQNLAKNKPFRVSVEGNIGSGKSTLMKYFQRFPYIQTHDEPLDKWRNVGGKTNYLL